MLPLQRGTSTTRGSSPLTHNTRCGNIRIMSPLFRPTDGSRHSASNTLSNLVQRPSILMRGLDGLSRWQRSCSFHVEPAKPSRRYLRLNTNVYLKFWYATQDSNPDRTDLESAMQPVTPMTYIFIGTHLNCVITSRIYISKAAAATLVILHFCFLPARSSVT